MKKIVLAMAMLCAVVSATARQQKVNYNKSVYSNVRSYPVNTAAVKATQKAVSKNFPGWSTLTDKVNGSFTVAYGPAMNIPGGTPAAKATYCMEHMLAQVGINKNDWKLLSSNTSGNKTYLNYTQTVAGHKVFMSKLSFQFTDDGRLLKIQMRNFGTIDKGVTASVKANDALNTAVSDLSGITISDKQVGDWDWFAIPAANGYTVHPAWHFTVNGKQDGQPVKLTGYVDAITGALIYRTNEVKDDYNLTIKGTVYKYGTLNPATLEALPDINLTIGVNTYTTDTSGYYSNPGLTLPVTTTVPLAGLWSTVFDDPTGLTPSAVDVVSVLGTTYTYPTAAPSSSRHVNAYYHVNRVHNFMKRFFPAFTGMDFSLPTNVDLTSGTCNAYYDGTSINFYAAGGGCNSFAELGDVVYHEYGHGISDHMYTNVNGTTIQNGALNEANSDIWGLSITRIPILAQNAFTPSQAFIRRYDMTPQIYPQDLVIQPWADPHENGQIIAGSWWDVGVNVNNTDTMARLFTSVYWDGPDGPDGTEGMVYQNILVDALMADDNDNNLANGTPHYSQIVAAFAKHGIYLEQDVTFSHSEVTNVAASVPIPVDAIIDMQNTTPYQHVLLYYRNHASATWDSIVMTTSNNVNFTANIPAQDTGTVMDYYFCIRDGFDVANAYFPVGYNPTLPSYQSTIPYQFAVSITPMDSTTFETNATGWTIGNNPGDNATTGKWKRVLPVANAFVTTWPGGDHTTGAGECLLTGNGSGGFNPVQLSNGTTTTLSPSIDISGYNYPVVEYYRWFSNDQGQNFKNDPWQVMIKDASGSNWQLVERTYQSDYNWRRRIFAVNEYLPAGTTNIQMRFMASDSVLTNWDSNGQSLTAGGVDDFYMYDAKAVPNSVTNVVIPKAKVYPNPADQQVEITFGSSSNANVRLYDMTGKQVYNAQVSGQTNYNVSTSQLPAGAYNLVIQGGKSVQSETIVVKHKQ